MTKSIVCFLLGFFSICVNAQSSIKSSARLTSPKDSIVTISIAAVGDLMCHSVQFDYAKTAQDSFNFNPVFSLVKKYISAADIACGNLETVTAGEKAKYTGYPNFNSPDEFVDAIKNAGFDLLFTANNHALDRGEKGVRQTIALIRNLGINQTGTFLSRRDRDSIRILNIKGIRTAFLAYSYGENGHYIPKTRTYIINLIDTTLIREDISSARKTGADIVVVYFHFGEEYHRTPSDYQENIVKASIHYGADIIIASHPHVVEPAIFFKTEDNQIDSGYAVYSLGNFISNQRKRYTDGGVILTIGITKNITKDSIYISKINYRPTWVYKGEYKGKRQFIIVPDDSADIDSIKIWLTPYKKSQMMRSFKDTKEILKIKDKEPSKMENLR